MVPPSQGTNKSGDFPSWAGESDSALSDRALFLRYQREDNLVAFQEFYQRVTPRIRQFLGARRVAPAERLEDLIQSIWLKIHRTRALYDPKFEPLQWVFVIARTLWLDDLRAQKGGAPTEGEFAHSRVAPREVPIEAENTENILLQEEMKHQTVLQIENRPGTTAHLQAEVFRLRVFEEEDYEEIARVLQLKEPYVRQLFRRAKEWLVQQWGSASESEQHREMLEEKGDRP